jgi:hypothetical protein
MNEVLRPDLDKFCLVYLDDIMIYGRDKKEHLEYIRLVLEQLREHRLYAKMSEFLRSTISYLSHNIYSAGNGVEERKIWAVSSCERPKNLVNL